MGTVIRTAEDLDSVDHYAGRDAFFEHVAGQSDMQVDIFVDDHGVAVEHWGQGQPDQMTFTFPFNSSDMVSWVYHVENRNSVRFDVHSDALRLVEQAGVLEDGSPAWQGLHDFVEMLLWDRHIDLNGTDLLLVDSHGEPAEMTATHVWETPHIGSIMRPYQPHRFQPTVAKLYGSGKLALAWSTDLGEPSVPTDYLIDDLLVVDFSVIDADDVLDLYDEAYARFASQCRWLG